MMRGTLNWMPTMALSAMRRRADGRVLMLYVSRDGDCPARWLIAALESDAERPAPEESIESIASRVFDDHSHAIIPSEPTLQEALASAEKYAKWWSKSGAVSGKCDCEPIGTEVIDSEAGPR